MVEELDIEDVEAAEEETRKAEEALEEEDPILLEKSLKSA
jgi:hypothetical protein